ncbi:MAG: hypothetical protein M1817_003277 [Caeruleum heppii]|nr:MAG: hypothetical protein M1817_003277 [Caeruleum heppii]
MGPLHYPRTTLLAFRYSHNILLRSTGPFQPRLSSTSSSPSSLSSSATLPTTPPPTPDAAPPSTTFPSSSHPLKHHDLTSFLAHANAVNLSKTSTLYNGTLYEYTVLDSLSRFGFSLTRRGGRLDRGIDLLGHWALPSFILPHGGPPRVLVQCKALSRGPTPSLIRELEGAYNGAPAGWRNNEVLGVLVTTGPATKGVREAMACSRMPLVFFQIGVEGVVRQGWWNHGAEERGLKGVGVGMRYLVPEGDDMGDGDGPVMKEIVLNWKGEVLDLAPKGGKS